MSQPQANAPAPGGKKKDADKPAADYKVLVKSIKDTCDVAMKALAPLCISPKDADKKDILPLTDLFGKTIASDISVYKTEYGKDIKKYLGGSAPRKTKAGAVRDSVSSARTAMIKAYEAVKKAAEDVDEAQSILDTQRKLFNANNKEKMAEKLKNAEKRAKAAADQQAKLAKELAEV